LQKVFVEYEKKIENEYFYQKTIISLNQGRSTPVSLWVFFIISVKKLGTILQVSKSNLDYTKVLLGHRLDAPAMNSRPQLKFFFKKYCPFFIKKKTVKQQ
jgi:hypothetical protein